MPGPYSSQELYTILLHGKETTWGTVPASFAESLPIMQPRFNPEALRHVLDSGFRGQVGQEYDMIPGPGEGTVSWQGNVYVDTFPALLNMMLGTDAVTGTTTYTHALTAAIAPPSGTFQWQTNAGAYNFAGARLSDLTINWNSNDGAVTYSAQGMSKLGVVEASPATAAYSSVTALAGWQASITVGGAQPANLLEGQLRINRKLRPLHASKGTQDITNLYAGMLHIDARLTFEFSGTTEYDYYTAAGNNIVVITFTQGSDSLAFTMSKAGWRLADIEESTDIYTAVAQITGLANSTDGPTSAAPFAATAVNSVSAGY